LTISTGGSIPGAYTTLVILIARTPGARHTLVRATAETARVVYCGATRHTCTIETRKVGVAAHVALIVLVGSVGYGRTIKTRRVVTEAHVTLVVLKAREVDLGKVGRGREKVLIDTGINEGPHKGLHEEGPGFLAGRSKRSTSQLTKGSHVRDGPLEVGGRSGRKKVIDGRPVLPIKLRATQEARPKVDRSRLLVLIDAKAAGEVEHLIELHDAARALELMHFGIRIGRGTSRLSGGHANDKIKGDNDMRSRGGKDVSDIKVEVDGERNTLATRQLRHILPANRRQPVRRN
jgi:hypothetical protein